MNNSVMCYAHRRAVFRPVDGNLARLLDSGQQFQVVGPK